jgi:hypothetical protein
MSGIENWSPKIQFESIQSHFNILNPARDFAEDAHTVTVRKDPLLGDTSVYNPFLKDKAKLFFGECDAEVVGKLIKDSEKSCFLCGEGILKNAPKYPPGLVGDGRIRSGEAILFPNLFSIAQYHAVVSLCNAHFLKLTEFTSELVADGLIATQKFLGAVYRHDPSAIFADTCALPGRRKSGPSSHADTGESRCILVSGTASRCVQGVLSGRGFCLPCGPHCRGNGYR